MRRLSPRFRARSLLRTSDTIADTIIDGPRLRLPPPAVVLALVAGLALAVVVDRALAREPDRHDAATEPHARRMQVRALSDDAVVSSGRDSDAVDGEAARPRLGAATRDARGRVTAPIGDAVAVLARNAALEAELVRTLVDGRTPFAATVLLEVGTGRVLAIAEHSTRGDATGFALMPTAKAASVFKIVTTAALLRADVPASTKVCMHGGKTRMQPALLVDNPRRDRLCTTMSDALPLSQNVAIAKLALKHLEPGALRAEAERFGFLSPLAADIAIDSAASTATIPDDPFGFANAAAGFGEVKISALHGAVLAATIAQGGVMVAPRFVDDVEGTGADSIALDPSAPHRVLDEADAKKIAAMLEDTVSRGTARRSFSQGPRLKHSAAGKTGSLADYTTGLDTSWFVGFAPAERPRVAVATVVVNTAKWHVKAPYVAKEALRAYFKSESEKRSASAPSVVASR